ncbi:MAG: PKD domain-containing protein [Bacteroidia bacterium]|nr:PKD domain-containing protein [Bacteroidia bacterium]
MKNLYIFISIVCAFMICQFSNAQTGETCATAQVISSLPFSATGLTATGASYGSLPCSGSFPNYMSGGDYLFKYTPPVNQTVGIILSNTGYAVGLFVTTLCPDEPSVTCVANNNAYAGNPSIADLLLTAGTTYYFIISSVSTVNAQTNFDITVTTCGNPPTASFTYNQTDLEVSFTNASADAVSYLWYFGDETIILPPPLGGDTTENPVHVYGSYGTYTVTLIAYNTCDATDTLNFQITLICAGTMPEASFTFSQDVGTVQFTSTATGATSYEWYFGDELVIVFPSDTTPNPTHTYLIDGTYTVMFIAINECGGDTAYAQITVIGTGIITNNNCNHISYYPNPVNDILNITITSFSPEKFNIELYNIVGTKIYSGIIPISQGKVTRQIGLNTLCAGVYYLKIYSGFETKTYKIIKK